MLHDYADKVFAGTRALILTEGYVDYVLEVSFMTNLAGWLSENGWPSCPKGTYPSSKMRSDMVTQNGAGEISIVCEAKQFVRDYPSRPRMPLIPNLSIPQQHLGIKPGKDNNAVHDVLHKLELAESSHVSLLLIHIETYENPGHADICEFIRLASLDDGRWQSRSEDWPHKHDARFRFICHLWMRSVHSI